MSNNEWARFIEHQLAVYGPNHLGRKAKNYEFAEYLGVDEAYISHWLKGKRVPTGDLLDGIAAKLGVGAYEAAGKSARLPQNKWLWIIAERLPALPEDVQAYFANEVLEASKKSLDADRGKRPIENGNMGTVPAK